MPRMTLLEMTQDVLSSLDSDNVNSISDTEESLQVARIIKETFYEILASRDWPFLEKVFTLTASGDSAKPTKMTVPDNIVELRTVKYDKRKSGATAPSYSDVVYKSPETFLVETLGRNADSAEVTSVTEGDLTLLIFNNRAPSFYTSFDERTVWFDSYDSGIDSTLQSSKTICTGKIEPDWQETDLFKPQEIPVDMFPYLMAEAKSMASLRLKRTLSDKDELNAKRHRVGKRFNKTGAVSNRKYIDFVDYGRR